MHDVMFVHVCAFIYTLYLYMIYACVFAGTGGHTYMCTIAVLLWRHDRVWRQRRKSASPQPFRTPGRDDFLSRKWCPTTRHSNGRVHTNTETTETIRRSCTRALTKNINITIIIMPGPWPPWLDHAPAFKQNAART